MRTLTIILLFISGITYGQITKVGGNSPLSQGYVSIKKYGAKGDGATSDATAFQSAIDYCEANNKTLYIPDGEYLIDAQLTIDDTLSIVGNGRHSLITVNLNDTVFNISSSACQFRDFKIRGQGVGSGNTATIFFSFDAVTRHVFEGVHFYETNGFAIRSLLTDGGGSDPYFGGHIIDCKFVDCYYGIRAQFGGQYTLISSSMFVNCAYGMHIGQGNWSATGCHFTGCDYAMLIDDSGNDSHASITGCIINHNTVGLDVDDIDNGLTVTACQLNSTTINLDNTSSVGFIGNEMIGSTFNFDGSLGTVLADNMIASLTVNDDVNGNTSYTTWSGNTTIGADSAVYTIEGPSDAGDLFKVLNKSQASKFRILSTGATVQPQLTGSITDGTPTDAEIDAIVGDTPANMGAGYKVTILDSNGSALLYKVESDGSNWQYSVMTIAL